ncbi:MAG: sigma 54 modulation protein/ribosomal protein S30EA [Chloroflexi bacterium OLB15]|nr:MAG: sigma 54 modulation protein/ribosomal protein S30EA [Chloroflexi bacterium OLB15]
MEIQIYSNNLRLTDQVEEFAHKKLEKLGRYLPKISEARLELNREHTRRGEDIIAAQITVRHERGAILRSEERYPADPQTAINLALDKMYKQIARFKSKRNPKGREKFSASLEELNLAEELPLEGSNSTEIQYAAIEEASSDHAVVRRKEIVLTPMSEEEAVEQMELLGHTFFLFQEANTQETAVVYRRHDGSYGILKPTI